ncbi:branched-chain amino acid ABC transporter permease [Nocardioides sp. GY 10113]|uniref:branched-chain amino acid ABC transporter permease n=1 Tax=Nocardioides sp. GY 10113 TaxID=2569761 RepID=UPI0010A93411|nr:branched-chain amino acid ABC transporter permease [Nocardioides sp. GY 10113]TIC88591.1 branched-chain amino acid ABC transporter permease [Nocardioides sp. GY 10113]
MMAKWSAFPTPVKIVVWALLALLAYALPLLEPPFISTPGVDFGGVLFTVSIYGLVALGLNIVVGYAGLLDLGYVGFYAIGAYTVAILTSFHASWPLLLAIPAGVVVAMLSGVLLGWPTLRVRGDYLAIVTLGFGEIIRLVAVNTEWLGASKGIPGVVKPPSLGGDEGWFDIPHLFWGDGTVLVDTKDTTTFLKFGVLDQIPYYWMALTAVILVLIADILIKNSRVGRAWEATREDEDAAELMGVPTFKFKLLAFATGAFVGGLAGGLYATRQGFINPQSFLLLYSILFLAAVVVGGQGNRWGVLIGAILVAYLPQRFREFDDFRVLAFGLALVALAALRPEGLLPPKRTVRAKHMEQELEDLEEGHDGSGGEENARV